MGTAITGDPKWMHGVIIFLFLQQQQQNAFGRTMQSAQQQQQQATAAAVSQAAAMQARMATANGYPPPPPPGFNQVWIEYWKLIITLKQSSFKIRIARRISSNISKQVHKSCKGFSRLPFASAFHSRDVNYHQLLCSFQLNSVVPPPSLAARSAAAAAYFGGQMAPPPGTAAAAAGGASPFHLYAWVTALKKCIWWVEFVH